MEHNSLLPRNSKYKSRIMRSFKEQSFMKHIGARLTLIKPGCCEISVDYTKQLTQQHGFLHGGLISTLADNSAAFAAYTLLDAQSSLLTIEMKINFLKPVIDQSVTSRGIVIKHGEKLTICKSEVFTRKNPTSLIAVAQSTFMTLDNINLK